MRELILLSPYRLPAQSTQMLANDDVACFLNGYVCLWHPAAVLGAERPPIVASPYDYEQPRPGQIFAVPESPPLLLPDDWNQRVLEAHALAFPSSPSRESTLANFKQAMSAFEARESAVDASGGVARPESSKGVESLQVPHALPKTSGRATQQPTIETLLKSSPVVLAPFF